MASSSSLEAVSSSHNSANRGRSRVAGIPQKCWCGHGIVEKISMTKDNPYRRYYRCAYAFANRLRNDPHVFKWVDAAYQDEIEQLDYQVGVLEEGLLLLKSEVRDRNETSGNPRNQGEDPPHYVTEQAMKRMMAMVFGACVLVVVLGVVLKK